MGETRERRAGLEAPRAWISSLSASTSRLSHCKASLDQEIIVPECVNDEKVATNEDPDQNPATIILQDFELESGPVSTDKETMSLVK